MPTSPGMAGRRPFLALLLALGLLVHPASSQFETDRECFCRAGECVDACSCAGDSIDAFVAKFQPALQDLLKRDFFRYFKVNMDKPCPYWPDDRECASRECGIEQCDDIVPAGLRQPLNRRNATKQRGESASKTPDSGQPSAPGSDSEPGCAEKTRLGDVDGTLTGEQRAKLQRMDEYDTEEELKFCEVDDEDSSEMHYVDLAKNPERYTGYKGDGAVRIWKSIYDENCFKPDMKFDKNFLLHPNTFGLCFEKRVFYRLISGFHSAITVSIASYNYKPPAVGGFAATGTWVRNVDMFRGRFGTKWGPDGPQRLMNVYFVFLLELRALVKAAPYLKEEMFYTGNDVADAETRRMVKQLIQLASSMPAAFDEREMFTGVEASARELREQFRTKFHNISRIMDCVGCDKCRLWGKVQVQGMGAALKILFSDGPGRTRQIPAVISAAEPPFQLSRNEVVALLQSLGRYSSSIHEVDLFRREMGIEPVSSRVAREEKAAKKAEL